MIKLYNFGTFGNLADPSPYCLKVDAYMRMSGIEFECVSGMDGIKKAPKGKLPYIEHDGQIVADSSFIIAHLREHFGDSLDEWMTKEQRATSHAFTKMMDENLYWCLVWARWVSDELWPQLKGNFFAAVPALIRNPIAAKVRKGVINDLKSHGLGRHSEAEIKQIMSRDLQALSDLLGDSSYFFGDRPSSLDAIAYGFLAEFALAPMQSSFTQTINEYPNLVSFCQRIQSTYYPE